MTHPFPLSPSERLAALRPKESHPQAKIADGRCAYAKPNMSLYDQDQCIAALIDAEAWLFDYAESVGDDAPRELWHTIYKVRDAIRANEEPNARVSVRTGAERVS